MESDNQVHRWVATFAAYALCAGSAAAQALPHFSDNAASDTVQLYFMNDVAGNRKNIDYDPTPVRIGDINIRPQLQFNLNYDGNWINRSDTVDYLTGATEALPALQSRFGPYLPPALSAQIAAGNVSPKLAEHHDEEFDIDPGVFAQWERGGSSVSFDAAGHFYRYAHLVRENRSEFHSDLVAVIGLYEKSSITLTAGADSRAEVPGANGTAVLDYYGFGPSIHTSPTVSATAYLKFGRVISQLSGLISRDYYSSLALRTADLLNPTGQSQANLPGTLYITQRYRFDQADQLIGSMTYNSSDETQYFVRASYQYLHQLEPQRDSAGRPIHPFDTDTYGLMAGLAKSFDRIVVFQGGIGWQFHRYADPFYANTSRLFIQGAADWYPTPLISFRATWGQTYQGSAIYGVGDISVRDVTLRADYEFRPNIEVWFLVSNEWDHYPTSAGTATTANSGGSRLVMQSGNFEIDYKMNRGIQFGINVGFHDRISSDPVVLGRFAGLRAGVTLTIRH